MVLSTEFDEKLEKLMEDEVERLVKNEFIEIICGDWEENEIRDVLKLIRKKSNDENGTNLLLLYLFAEMLREGKISLTWEDNTDDEEISYPVNIEECLCEENYIYIVSDKNASIKIELKDKVL